MHLRSNSVASNTKKEQCDNKEVYTNTTARRKNTFRKQRRIEEYKMSRLEDVRPKIIQFNFNLPPILQKNNKNKLKINTAFRIANKSSMLLKLISKHKN